jgi:hypothetical protein
MNELGLLATFPFSPAIAIKGPDGKLNAAVMVTTVPRY